MSRYEVEIEVADKGASVTRLHTYIIEGHISRIDAEVKALRKASWRFRGAAVRVHRVMVR